MARRADLRAGAAGDRRPALQRGFGIVERPYTPLVNPLTQLPVGRRAVVTLSVERLTTADDPSGANRPAEYLVVTEPIPCGAAVVERTLAGDFDC